MMAHSIFNPMSLNTIGKLSAEDLKKQERLARHAELKKANSEKEMSSKLSDMEKRNQIQIRGLNSEIESLKETIERLGFDLRSWKARCLKAEKANKEKDAALAAAEKVD